MGAGEGGFDLHGDEREPFRRISHAGAWDPIQCTAFSGDSSRLFLGAQQNLQMRTYVDALSWSPDNRWLAAALEPLSEEGSHRGKAELAVFPMGPVDD